MFGVGTYRLLTEAVERVPVAFACRLMEEIANRNEGILYERRERVDTNSAKVCVTPVSHHPIDVVIPVIEKDLETAVLTIESVRQLVHHKIRKIYLVAPNREVIRNFSVTHGCVFVDENTILPSPETRKLPGWILQQFLKLNADTIVEQDHYLVIDADTILLRPHVFMKPHFMFYLAQKLRWFLTSFVRDHCESVLSWMEGYAGNGIYLINIHTDCQMPRKQKTAQILGNKMMYLYDFVPHHMLFSKKIIKQMKRHIEEVHGALWHTAILQVLKEKGEQGFSEYDLYITYLTGFSSESYRFVSNANVAVHRSFLPSIVKTAQVYAHQCKSISMHDFIRF